MHDTPSSVLNWAPVGLGVVWTVQDVPFHTSASVAVSSSPVAMQGAAPTGRRQRQ